MLKNPPHPTGAALVIGGGIGGIQASLDLADSGFMVYLLEKRSAIGGTMAGLDKTFPTNDCSMCILSPKLVECGRHLNIEIITDAELLSLQGEPGDFTAEVGISPRFVRADLCTGCGECVKKCPVKVPDGFNGGLGERRAVHRLYEQAYPNTFAIDMDVCRKCGLCARVCSSGAIDLDMKPEIRFLRVGAVIATAGFEPFDAGLLANYGHGVFPNVLTAMEFERILSASGPYRGHLVRPSDGRPPSSIAWIQCVGSRDTHRVGNGYCSSVCCTYAIKEAVVAREHSGKDLRTAIFHIDVRTHGKDFERYYERARNEHGVRFVKSVIHRIYRNPDETLMLRYSEDGAVREECFDLVVLSTGMVQSGEGRILVRRLGTGLNRHGFCETDELFPTITGRPGVFAAGAFSGPKDIPETVTGASAAAAEVSALLAPSRNSLTRTRTYPQEIRVHRERPRIGVFICNCGVNIGGVVDVPRVRACAGSLPYVVHAEETLFACAQDSQQRIRERIAEHRLNRVVVAACTPRTHEALFRETIREAGLNGFLLEMANIRDQCSWVHQGEPEKATRKAMDLVRMAASKARLSEPLFRTELEVEPSALVVGGGAAGLVCALSIAGQGFGVHLVEATGELGGNARRLSSTLGGADVQVFLGDLVKSALANPLITVHTGSRVRDVRGFVGRFCTTVENSEGTESEIRHGVAVIATGAEPFQPDEYQCGAHPGVMTLTDMERLIIEEAPRVAAARNVVLIQCVGSRESDRPYCSRTCCGKSMKLALELLRKNPGVRIYVLYRDVRTYGFMEEYYQEAREKGVQFIRYDPLSKPRVEPLSPEEGLRVTVNDISLGEELSVKADLVGLAAAMVPASGNRETAGLFKVPLNQDGFFMEAHIKLRPVDFPAEGVFVCGLAHGPKLLGESILQAGAAASRAAGILARGTVEAGGAVSEIDREKCRGCGTCTDLCPFGAVTLVEGERRAEVNEALCKGCGVCASSCRSGAADIRGFTDGAMHAMIRSGALCTPERGGSGVT